MKRIIPIILFLVVGAYVTYAGNFFEDEKSTTLAIVLKAIKQVDFKKDGNSDWEEAKRGQRLKGGDALKTGDLSSSILKFVDGSIVRLRQKTEVVIRGEKDGKMMNKDVAIEYGDLGFNVQKRPGEQFRFSSPTAVASIKGTEGVMLVGEDKTTLIITKSSFKIAAAFQALMGSKQSVDVGPGEKATALKNGEVIKVALTKEDQELVEKLLEASRETKDELLIKFRDADGKMKEIEIK
ncbi:FecR domain-containing protein [Chloroherpeton thalassium]|nr:FecR domain-containing protein [Chloroherpeton thalassium]